MEVDVLWYKPTNHGSVLPQFRQSPTVSPDPAVRACWAPRLSSQVYANRPNSRMSSHPRAHAMLNFLLQFSHLGSGSYIKDCIGTTSTFPETFFPSLLKANWKIPGFCFCFFVVVLSMPPNLLYEWFVSLFAKVGAETHPCLVNWKSR